jgi:hypothetical protein
LMLTGPPPKFHGTRDNLLVLPPLSFAAFTSLGGGELEGDSCAVLQ